MAWTGPNRSHLPPGQVAVEGQGGALLDSKRRPGEEVRRTRYVWTPPPELRGEVHAEFRLEFDCFTGADGVRHFSPSKGVGTLLIQAALGGFALLASARGLSKKQRDRYHMARLVCQQGPRLREYLARAFTRERDLYLPRAGRTGLDEAHVLPDGLGLDGQGGGEPWNPSALIERGREKAVAAGCTRPTTADCIRFGLLEAALRNPLGPRGLNKAESLGLVRLALFDLGPSSARVPESVIRRVGERLRQALEPHLADGNEAFNRWFFDHIDNLVHQIAKKKRPGGPLPREDVRQALLEVVFRAYTRLGECVHYQMLAFREALPEPLRGAEWEVFNSLYLRQPWLGGLPLVLLHDRFDFVREAVLEIWSSPRDRRLTGALLRLLQYYGEMAVKKRAADRQYKRQRHHRNAAGRSAQILGLDPDRDAAPEADAGLFQAIAAAHREVRRAGCGCGTLQDWRARLIEEKTQGRLVVLEDMCGKCGHREEISLSRQQFKKLGTDLRGFGHDPDL